MGTKTCVRGNCVAALVVSLAKVSLLIARLGDLCEEFGRSKAGLSVMFNTTLLWIYNRWDGLLTDPFTHPFFTPARLATYCQAVRTKTKVELDIWGGGGLLMAQWEASAGLQQTNAFSTTATNEFMLLSTNLL